MPQPSPPTRLSRQFIRFTLVGAVGFLIDSGVLLAAIKFGHYGLFLGRCISYLTAATFTWAANRAFTFPGARREDHAGQWMRFVLVNAVGGLANFGAYAWLVKHIATFTQHPVLGVAAGSCAGLLINFFLSRALVFRH